MRLNSFKIKLYIKNDHLNDSEMSWVFTIEYYLNRYLITN